MDERINRVVWFEIPTANFERGINFYESVFQTSLIREDAGALQLAVFPHENGAASGAVVHGGGMKPSAETVVIYLNADPSIDACLARVKKHGGDVVLPKTELPDNGGFFARVRDSEGNIVGVHAVS